MKPHKIEILKYLKSVLQFKKMQIYLITFYMEILYAYCVKCLAFLHPGMASSLMAPQSRSFHAWFDATCMGVLCGFFMNQCFCPNTHLHSCLAAMGISQPHLTTNSSPNLDVTLEVFTSVVFFFFFFL